MNTTEIRTALVTGADRGLGYCIVKELLDHGWRVFAGKYLEDYSLLDELAESYPELYPVKLDSKSGDDMKKVRDIIAEKVGKLDLLVSNAAGMGGAPTDDISSTTMLDTDTLAMFFRTNSYAAPMLVDTLLPLLKKSDYRRLFFTSSEISSVRLMRRTGGMRYAMTKTALNLGVRMIFNALRPEGFTFRLYQPGWMKRMGADKTLGEGGIVDPAVSAREAVRQILEDRIDEDRLVLVDYMGRELSF